MSSYRSGLNETIAQRKELYDLNRDFEKELEELCPNPNPRTVERLTKDWESGFEVSTYVLPWKRNEKYKDGYNPKNVLFYARILTLLAEMGIYPPPEVSAMGGGGPSLGGGPEAYAFVPEGNSSSHSLRVANSEEEAKEIVNSSEQGGLADAARGQLPQLRDRNNFSTRRILAAVVNQARRLVIWSGVVKDTTTTHKKNDDDHKPADVELTELDDFFDDVEDEKKKPVAHTPIYFAPPFQGNRDAAGNPIFVIEDDDEKAISNLPQDSFNDMNPGPFEGSEEISRRFVQAMELDSDEFGELEDDELRNAARRHPRFRAAMQRLDRAATQIRRRLPWSRLTPEQKARVEDLLPPAIRGNFDNEEVLWQADEPAVSWWRRLGSRRARSRISWMQIIMWRFLLPLSILTSGVVLYYREGEGDKEDELVTLYRALPDTNWFKQGLDLFSWVKIIPMTPRHDNYVLLHQIANPELLHFVADTSYLWKIGQLVRASEYDHYLQYFNVFKSDMLYRSTHNAELTKLVKNKGMWDFAMVYVAQSTHPRGLPLMSAFFDSGLPPTQELIDQQKKVNTPITLEHQTAQRTLKFEELLAAFANAIKHTKDFRTPWMKEMMKLYHTSKFSSTLEQLAFTNVLRDLELNSSLYQDDAKSVLSDFLRRYTTKDGDINNVVPFQQNLNALKYNEDIFAPVKQLLETMAAFRNDGKMDALAYEFLNQKWEQHSAQTEYKTFEDAVAAFELSEKTKFSLYGLIESMQRGLVPFVDAVRLDFANQPVNDDGFPVSVVGLNNDGAPQENELVPRAPPSRELVVKQSVGANRRIKVFGAQSSNEGFYDYKTVPFFRFENVVLLQLGFVIGVMAKNGDTMQIATLSPPDNEENDDNNPYAVQIWQKPVEQSNSSGLVLAGNTWYDYNLDLLLIGAMALMASFMVAQYNNIGPERAYVHLAKVGTVLVGGAKFAAQNFLALPFKQKLIATSATLGSTAVAVYRNEIASTVTTVGKGAAQLVAIVVAVSLLATASDFYSASQGRKKRKL